VAEHYCVHAVQVEAEPVGVGDHRIRGQAGVEQRGRRGVAAADGDQRGEPCSAISPALVHPRSNWGAWAVPEANGARVMVSAAAADARPKPPVGHQLTADDRNSQVQHAEIQGMKVLFLAICQRGKNRPNPTGRINNWTTIFNELTWPTATLGH
jgi:hypothetical protein